MKTKYQVKKTYESITCDVCGKKIDSRDRKAYLPYFTVYCYRFYNDKLSEDNFGYSLISEKDLCMDCSLELTDIFLENLNEFMKKENGELLRKIKEAE